MDIDLRTCKQCGRFFSPPRGVTAAADAGPDLCTQSLLGDDEESAAIEEAVLKLGIRSPRQIARHTGIPIDKVKPALKASQLLAHEALAVDLCSRCQNDVAQPGSEFCLACRLEFFKSFGDMLADLKENPSIAPQYRIGVSRMQGAGGVADKRRRTGSHRFGEQT